MTTMSSMRSDRRGVRSLPPTEWPVADRRAWAAACRPGPRFAKGGAASHLAPITRADLARRYGYYLDFLDRTSVLDRDAQAAGLVTPACIALFIAELQKRVSSVTVSGTIYKVRRAAECIEPGHDFGWLAEIGKDLAMLERPKDKFDRVVLTERLAEAGLSLIHEANSQINGPLLRRAILARNGLMIALLAFCPIRQRNFAALEIGRCFVEINGTWWIVLDDTKSGRLDHRPIPTFLTGVIESYLERYRPVLLRHSARGKNCPTRFTTLPVMALWVGYLGAPLSYAAVERVVTETTRTTLACQLARICSEPLARQAQRSTHRSHRILPARCCSTPTQESRRHTTTARVHCPSPGILLA